MKKTIIGLIMLITIVIAIDITIDHYTKDKIQLTHYNNIDKYSCGYVWQTYLQKERMIKYVFNNGDITYYDFDELYNTWTKYCDKNDIFDIYLNDTIYIENIKLRKR